MRRSSRIDIVLGAAALASLCLAVYFGARYGNVYHVGDSEYRRHSAFDQGAYLIPALTFSISVGLLALRYLDSGVHHSEHVVV
jgi:hypothetical protein